MTNQIVAAVLGGILCLCTGLVAGYMMGYWSALYDADKKRGRPKNTGHGSWTPQPSSKDN